MAAASDRLGGRRCDRRAIVRSARTGAISAGRRQNGPWAGFSILAREGQQTTQGRVVPEPASKRVPQGGVPADELVLLVDHPGETPALADCLLAFERADPIEPPEQPDPTKTAAQTIRAAVFMTESFFRGK